MESKFHSMEEWRELVAGFEAGTLPRERWTHAEHLAVACWYVRHLGEAPALDHMRRGIRHLNECLGGENTDTAGYHETLTRFWLGVVADFLRGAGAADDLAAVNRLVAEFANARGLWKSAYTFDVVKSVEARRQWIEPDAVPTAARP
jgi:hypothetical protein